MVGVVLAVFVVVMMGIKQYPLLVSLTWTGLLDWDKSLTLDFKNGNKKNQFLARTTAGTSLHVSLCQLVR